MRGNATVAAATRLAHMTTDLSDRARADLRVVRGRRPARSWVRVGRGTYRTDVADGFLADLQTWSGVLPPGACFTPVTALRAHRLWLPRLPADTPVFASISRDQDRLRRPEIRTLRHTSPVAWEVVDGVPLARPAEAVLVSSRDLSPLDLVTVIDGALQLGACHRHDLLALADTRRWGAKALRSALRLADGRSESAWETALRLFHRCLDVPVEPQVSLHDCTGRFVARADLLVTGHHWVHEYDGAGHRDAAAHADDLRRERALLGIGYLRRGFTAGDLTTRAAATMRELDHALGRASDPARLARWRRLVVPSTLTAAGVRRLELRWARPATRLAKGHIK
jgi:hypothetical protein